MLTFCWLNSVDEVQDLTIYDLENFDIEERSFDTEKRRFADDGWITWRRGGLTYIDSIAGATGLWGKHHGSTLKISDNLRSRLFGLLEFGLDGDFRNIRAHPEVLEPPPVLILPSAIQRSLAKLADLFWT